MSVDCIHVVFCRPLGRVTGFNAVCNACLTGVPSGSLKMCLVNASLFRCISSDHECCLFIAYIYRYFLLCLGSVCLLIVLRVAYEKNNFFSEDIVNVRISELYIEIYVTYTSNSLILR